MNIIRTEQDGVEFFTIQATGESGMSVSGLARLCGVDQSTVTRLLQRTVITNRTKKSSKSSTGTDLPLMINDLPESLQAFVGQPIYLSVDSTYKNVKVIRDQICAAVIEYYALDSRQPTSEAKYALRKLNQMGVRAWIQGITGWQANQSPPPPERTEGIFPELKLNLPPLKTFEDACVFFFTAGEWLANAKATVSAYRLFFTVIENEAYGDRPNADELIAEAHISKSSFYKSLKILKQAKLLPEWAKSDTRDFLEFRIRDRLKLELNGEIEVNTEVGLVDLLTPKEVIEIKAIQH